MNYRGTLPPLIITILLVELLLLLTRHYLQQPSSLETSSEVINGYTLHEATTEEDLMVLTQRPTH